MKIAVTTYKELKECSDEELLYEIKINSEEHINAVREIGFDPTLIIECKEEMIEEAKLRGLKYE